MGKTNRRKKRATPSRGDRARTPERAFPGVRVENQNRKSVRPEFETLQQVLELIEAGVKGAGTSRPEFWFPNSIAAESTLIRAFQGLQSASLLCASGYYVEARAVLRNVYEAAGLSRTLAHKIERAERWLHGGDWVKDKFAREFADEMQAKGETGASAVHWEMYRRLSQFAHPLAASCLSFNFDDSEAYRVKLYPEFDEKQMKATAYEITAVGIFTAYAFRNACAGFDVIPGWWHERLASITRDFVGFEFEHLKQDWNQYQERYDAIASQIRHSDELEDALRTHPNSLDNLRARASSSPDDHD